MPLGEHQEDADCGADRGRQQDDGQQLLPAEQCAQRGKQFEVALGHAGSVAQPLVEGGQSPQGAVAEQQAERSVSQADRGPVLPGGGEPETHQ
mmetsp:Transcript_29670/g.54944  ORF Transcript_29670/g.54944 Transcript_29670/m.54944 type:complete len:93 (+) Transcript_29670:645-923(+)